MIHQGMVDRLYFIVIIHLGIYRVKRDQREVEVCPRVQSYHPSVNFGLPYHSA